MKVLSSKADICSIYTKACKLIQMNKTLPDNVFISASKNFLFITFDDLHLLHFFNHIKQFLLETGESKFWLMAVNSPSKQGFTSSSDILTAIQFSVADSENDFLQTVNGLDDDNPASFHILASELLIAFSSRDDWVIFGSRDVDIAVCAISDPTTFDIFSSIYGSDLLNGVEAEEYAFGVTRDESLIEKFRQNYSSHTPIYNVIPLRMKFECGLPIIFDVEDRPKEFEKSLDAIYNIAPQRIKSECGQLPIVFDVEDGPKEFEKSLNELAVGDLVRLMQCPKCKQCWLIDEGEKYKPQLAIKLEMYEGWEKIDTTQLRKDFLLKSRGGITEEECMWAKCSKSRVKGVAYCIDHLYETGTRK